MSLSHYGILDLITAFFLHRGGVQFLYETCQKGADNLMMILKLDVSAAGLLHRPLAMVRNSLGLEGPRGEALWRYVLDEVVGEQDKCGSNISLFGSRDFS
jgi:hypothetical protein